MKTNKLQRNLRKGLTLVELAVVVLILGAIITLVAVGINPGEMKDKTAALKLRKDSSELLLHLERYMESNGSYPSEEQGIQALAERPTTGDIPEDYKPVVRKKASVKDPWGSYYALKYNDEGDPEIWTLGKDKQEGGQGKAKDFNIADTDNYPKAFKGKND
ncbi:MAG: type II secretion system protein GspG [Spirochaetota bacterium]